MKSLPVENFFLLRKAYRDITLGGMDSPDAIHGRFFDLLIRKKDTYGRGYNKFLHHETGLSTSYLSLLIAGKKRASAETQMKIAEALDVDYQVILNPSQKKASKQSGDSIQDTLIDSLLGQFQRREKVTAAVQALLTVEKLAPLQFLDVINDLEKIALRLELASTDKDQKTG